MTVYELASPRINSVAWGAMSVDGIGAGRDFKLFPGGGRNWDWSETNTHHVPGVQIADVLELIEQGSEIIVLSLGMKLALRVADETRAFLRSKNIEHYIAETREAVTIYNSLSSQGRRVGGLFHSTC